MSCLPGFPRLARRSADALTLACSLLVGCAPGHAPCLTAGACPEGEECLANRCVPEGGTIVPTDSLRVVCELNRASRGDDVSLEFEPRWRALSRIDAAFLLLEAEGEPAPPLPIEVNSLGTFLQHGGLLPPKERGLMARPGRARIDVTRLVRSWQGTASSHGLALRSVDGSPLPLSWGLRDGAPPRLEVYGR